ncbi:MAG: type I DNA topoisomerase [Firmicutes bacterium]|nr:type I DNA topoisomerase [Bacillota bacterium]
MSSTLVIVESPAKARTITRILGRSYKVRASMGHVRDLPRSAFGVDVSQGFKPTYITIRGKGKALQELRSEAKKADRIFLATDPDREGEAISWHLATVLGLDNDRPCRIEFHEVTKGAIQKAVRAPRAIDLHLVNAQQARRILDRIVGYNLSPLLWAKVRRGLSAGRVQSVAMRLVCDREREIQGFVSVEYWTVTAFLRALGVEASQKFPAKLLRHRDSKIEISDGQEAARIVAELKGKPFVVKSVVRKERKRYPAAPFITSTLQQEASRRFGFPARKTMRLAQELYEGLDAGPEGTVGLITYIRTDSARIAPEAQEEARRLIVGRWGRDFVPAQPPVYKARPGAQGAHEAIRPTSLDRSPEKLRDHLKRDQHRLYQLVFERFLASQMAPAVFDTVSVDIAASDYLFRATGSTPKFHGFMLVYAEKTDEDTGEESSVLPELVPSQELQLENLVPEQHFTEPPPRYTEAMLVKTLEERGIGRPSTYAPTIETIQERGYVRLENKRFVPTPLGIVVVDLLKERFPEIIDVEFTAGMEEKLDKVEEGELEWVAVLSDFYAPFEQQVKAAHEEVQEVTVEPEVTDEVCEACGRNMVVKWGRYGKFLACPGFPECRKTKPILEEIGVPCPTCGKQLVRRRTKKGRTFFGCSGYPECQFTSWNKPVDRRCPECGGVMVEKRGRGGATTVSCINTACQGGGARKGSKTR